MVKSVLLAVVLSLSLIAAPLWTVAAGYGAESDIGILAQNTYGYQDQYGYSHNQMHSASGGGCGGGNNMHYNTGNYQQYPHYGYQNPNYPYPDPNSNYQGYGWDNYQSGGGHHH